MGSPIAPTREQYNRLLDASLLKPVSAAPELIELNDGSASLSFMMPRQCVSLIVVSWQ
jgi:hypothetical protein